MRRQQAFIGRGAAHRGARTHKGDVQELQQTLQGAIFTCLARHGDDACIGTLRTQGGNQVLGNVQSNRRMLSFFQRSDYALAVFQGSIPLRRRASHKNCDFHGYPLLCIYRAKPTQGFAIRLLPS